MFNEKTKEWSPKQGKEIEVWKSPKYEQARAKAVELIKDKKYGLAEGDFWILMNETKNGKMGYTGLIISHNGCLKINDELESKYDPDCVEVKQDGYKNSLVCFYRNKAQGLFEVGEVSDANCKNAYPYAMAVKRLFDRVVLKLSKLAYDGIYGEDEADDFKRPVEEDKAETPHDLTKEQAENIGKIITKANEKGVLIETIITQYGDLETLDEKTVNTILRRLEKTK